VLLEAGWVVGRVYWVVVEVCLEAEVGAGVVWGRQRLLEVAGLVEV